MATIDQISQTPKTTQGTQDPVSWSRLDRIIVTAGRLGETRDRAQGDYARGQRTHADCLFVRDDFATGLRTTASPTATGDFATGMGTTDTPAHTGDFATGSGTEPVKVPSHCSTVSSSLIAA
jgi:hypothetical protein